MWALAPYLNPCGTPFHIASASCSLLSDNMTQDLSDADDIDPEDADDMALGNQISYLVHYSMFSVLNFLFHVWKCHQENFECSMTMKFELMESCTSNILYY